MPTESPAPFLSVVIPAYNEERRIAAAIRAVSGYLAGAGMRFEIIVVDDGSSDRTSEVVTAARADLSGLNLVRLDRNSGKGRAVQAGVLQARGEYIFFVDADQSTPIDQLSLLLSPLVEGRCDAAIASRALPGSRLLRRQTGPRRLLGKAFGHGFRALLVRGICDSQCGFKGFTRAAARTLFTQATSPTAIFDMEILLLAGRAGMTVAEIPVTWTHDPESRLTYNFRQSIGLVRELLRIRRHWRVRFPVKVNVIDLVSPAQSPSMRTTERGRRPTIAELVERGFDPRKGPIDVLFIFPPTTIADRYGKASLGDLGGDLPPLGVACLASFLRQHAFGVGILDCCALGLDDDAILEIVGKKDPRVIGISSTTYALPRALELTEKIRANFPDKLTVLGGAHANVAATESADTYPCFDVVAFGADGEYTILELLQQYAHKGYDRAAFVADEAALRKIKGAAFRTRHDVIVNPPRPAIANLDDLPLPARDLLPMERYIPLPNQYKRLPVAHMVVIRGCPYVCSFCDQAGTGGRMRSPQKSIDEVRHLVERYGVNEISFWDDTMTFNKKWMRDFCERLIAARLDVIWSCYAAINTVDEPLLQLMKRAGCWNIFYGIETGVPELMRNIEAHRKNTSADRIREAVRWTKEAGIEIRGSFMLALPGETPELARETIKFSVELDPDYAQFSITTPYPGTKLYNEIMQGKWGKLTTTNFSEFQGWNVVFLPEGYRSKEEVWAMERQAFRTFYFRPKFIVKKLLRIRSSEDIKRYYKGARALLGGFAYGPMPEHLREATGRN